MCNAHNKNQKQNNEKQFNKKFNGKFNFQNFLYFAMDTHQH